MLSRRLFALNSLGMVALTAQVLVMGEASEGFVSLFNGQDIDRWDGDEQLWSVDRGVIHASTRDQAALLKYVGGEYRDFDFRFEMKVLNGKSGVRIGNDLDILDSRADWTDYRMIVKGTPVQVLIAGIVVQKLDRRNAERGPIALRLESRSKAQFRNIRINKFS